MILFQLEDGKTADRVFDKDKKSNVNSVSSSNGTGLLHLQGEEVEDDVSLIYVEQANEAIGAVTDSETT